VGKPSRWAQAEEVLAACWRGRWSCLLGAAGQPRCGAGFARSDARRGGRLARRLVGVRMPGWRPWPVVVLPHVDFTAVVTGRSTGAWEATDLVLLAQVLPWLFPAAVALQVGDCC
jgi:hypothetical protein